MTPPTLTENTSTPSRLVRGGVEASPEHVGRLGLAVVATFAIIAVYAAHAAIPESPLTLPLESKGGISQVLPEGWAFFTRDPREPDVDVYAPLGDSWTEVDQSYHGAGLGFDRSSRHRSRELGYLLTELPASEDWQVCSRALEECLAESRPDEVANLFPGVRALCGQLAILVAEPIPWAWAGLNASRTAHVRLVDARC